jgi:hypothetical protein
VYGSAQALRAGLEERKQAYALAVACKERVEGQGTRRQVDQIARGLTREDWQELSAGAESKGLRLFAWARIELAVPETNGWQRWLLVRRNLEERASPAEAALRASGNEEGPVIAKQLLQAPKPDETVSDQARRPSDLLVMVPLSVTEIRRLFFRLVGILSRSFAYHLAWSFWRRAHQALARLCHYKRRNALASYLQLED